MSQCAFCLSQLTVGESESDYSAEDSVFLLSYVCSVCDSVVTKFFNVSDKDEEMVTLESDDGGIWTVFKDSPSGWIHKKIFATK
jgi:hypothetical protein